jgi:hypothetical protein
MRSAAERERRRAGVQRLQSHICECRCVWCGEFYVGPERSLFCRRSCCRASWRHPYRRARTAASRWWLERPTVLAFDELEQIA